MGATLYSMQTTNMEHTKPRKEFSRYNSLLRTLQKVVIFFLVLIICTGFFLGLELLRRRLSALEDTVDSLKDVCERGSHGKGVTV